MARIEPTDDERATLARAITRANGLAGEGSRAPIVAAVMEGDEVVAWGDNEVHVAGDPSRHAEIVAIAHACAERGTRSLAGCTLISTLQPCEMCLAAMRFAGIGRLVFAAGRADAGEGYFVFRGLTLDDFRDASDERFDWVGGVMAADVAALYAPGRS